MSDNSPSTISYLITCHNETDTLENLLVRLDDLVLPQDEIIILDDHSTDLKTIEILNRFAAKPNIKIHKHQLNSNYSNHKNFGKSLATKQYIFQIDADELPETTLIENVHALIELNPDIELFWIPRINDFDGVTDREAMDWGWRLNRLPDFKRKKLINTASYEYLFLRNNGFVLNEQSSPAANSYATIEYYPPIVNAFDPQGRLFKNLPTLKWEAALHERVVGAKTYVHLPYELTYAIIHIKTIATQVATNLKYNKEFSPELNAGFFVPPK
jgi:glycosyltransferase involved in cell wall biosynthesis